jgi:hypothetical protein
MQRSRRRRSATVVSVMTIAALVLAVPAQAAGPDPSKFTATAISPTASDTAPKSASGRLATSDATLLTRTDDAPVHVMVKLDYDATASYAGDVSGLAATSPSVTGKKLTGSSAPEVAYEGYTKGIDDTFRSSVAASIPAATVGQSLQRVYGGVAMTLPANQASKLTGLPGVAAVMTDELRQIDTDSSTTFIGAPTIWSQVGGQATAGKGVIFGDLDTGVWPEHPSFADNPALGDAPPRADGAARICNYGDNPLTPATDVFVCNHKLIGGQPFLETYNSLQDDQVYPDSARDSGGHGTHTTSTAAGGIVESAPIFGIDHGPISGVAPGAFVIEYKVCGVQGCFQSDSAAAVAQAILDGVNVINFSIGGGTAPFSDVVELAFLDAYNAGVLTAASAGNEGPGPSTAGHLSPWVLTVAASTQTRAFESTLTVTDGAASATFVGSSVTRGLTAATPIVLAQNIAGYDALCSTPLPVGAATGKLVACRRGVVGRIEKGSNVRQGGAAGMILYNLPLADTETDNHFLPTVHLADGTDFLAFLAAHPGATGSFPDGAKAVGKGDVMAAFSSRGPGGQFLKPDITAPGVQILAGNTPTPDEPLAAGPDGEYFQAIAGTSMSSPHIAGSAILLKAEHPTWSPGAIKSALMTTATTKVVKEDLVTPADPFDFGAGRVDLTKAGDTPVVFDETALRMLALGTDPILALNLNTPSINVPTMPGIVSVKRTATNVTDKTYEFRASTVSPAGSRISISPTRGKIRPGQSVTFEIRISSSAPDGQYFGQVNLESYGNPSLHLPVAFMNQQGDVSLTQTCAATTVKVGQKTTCTVTAANESFADTTVRLQSRVDNRLRITAATGAARDRGGRRATVDATVLAGKSDAVPAISAIDPAQTPGGGYLDLAGFDITPNAIGDEEALNFDVPAFVFGGQTYTRIGVVSNGYVVVGGAGGSQDIACCPPQKLPDPTRPNNVLAPYWSDLDGTGHPGVSVTTLTDGTNTWLVIQWNVGMFGVPSAAGGDRNMQVWIGLNGTEDVTYQLDTNAIAPPVPASAGLTIGAENGSGTGGAQLPGAPTVSSYLITTTPGQPGGSVTYTLTVRGSHRGLGQLTTSMRSDIVPGITRVATSITVTRK